MVRPPAKHQGAPADVDLVSFINDFLFKPQRDEPSTSPPLRTTPRYKRYRSMWRAAATSLVAKRRGVSLVTHLPSEEDLLSKKMPSSVSLCNGLSPSTDKLTREQPFSLSNGISIRDYKEYNGEDDVVIDVHAASPSATTKGGFVKDQPHQASSTHAIPKRSSKKPPRPPKSGLLRSGSHRAVRLKSSTRRAMMDTARPKKNRVRESTSNASFIGALIITICFVSIMLFQAFFGDDSKRSSTTMEGQGLEVVVSLSPPKL
ncbi:hypothetical protein L7F22_041862 [Adiantum nelumboides]|nr:hypothetical protein [Adiantum nelumboides]